MLNTEYTHKSRVINANTSFIFFFPIFYYYFITQPHFSTNPGLLFFFCSLSLITVPSLSTDKQNNTTLSLSLSLSYSLLRRSPATCSTEINFRTIIRRPVFLAPTRPSHFKVHSTHISILYF